MFLDELFPVCFQEIGSDYRRSFICGQLYRACCLYTDEHRQLWRPAQFEIPETSASLFTITSICSDAYNRSVPLHTPALDVNEEFPVVRAKKRPVILFPPVSSPSPGFVGQDHVLHKKVALVAPLYGVVKATGEAKFRQDNRSSAQAGIPSPIVSAAICRRLNQAQLGPTGCASAGLFVAS